MNKNNSFQIPILFLVFNRLETTKKVFEEIRKAKPSKLYIASDGSRENRLEEKEKVEEVRKYVLDNIDWKCKIKTLFRKENLGCKYAVSGALDWFFENVEQGIILEDDCLPSQSFFRFCDELLERYKNDEKIMSISGFNPLKKFDIKESYAFSKYFYCWGWATWRRAWKKNDLKLRKYQKIEKERKLKEYYPNFIERILREKRVKDVLSKKVNSWAIPWSISHQLNKSFSIIPKINLIKNIGFSKDSKHTKENKWDKKFLVHKSNEMEFPLKHPVIIRENKLYTKKCLNQELIRIILKKISLN
jgi:hypothetical protein